MPIKTPRVPAPQSDGDRISRRAVFLDRDGVINQVVFRDGLPGSPRHLREFMLEPGVGDALELLSRGDFRMFVVTNQPDLARGLLRPDEHKAMAKKLHDQLPMLEGFAVCPHDDRHACACRKPRPGLLLTLCRQENLEMASCWMIGDSARDTEAARLAGCRSILLERAYNAGVRADFRTSTLLQAVQIIVSMSTGNGYN
jgi:D-glycero-D-manno-heptose 1,7-bisphosphate phosphatase